MSLADRIKARRDHLMLSQTEASNQIGVSLRIYQAWEWGEVTKPRPSVRRDIEAWLTEDQAAA